MKIATPLVLAVALTGCSTETGIREDIPVLPSGNPNPIDNSERQTDVMLQTVVPAVDVLFMVDNSCSMGDDQDRLVENFPTFIRWFLGSGLEYHIGVVSSDVYDPAQSGKLQKGFNRKWISEDDNNQVPMFSQMAVLGTSGSGDERGRDAIYLGLELERDRYNQGFYRDDAALHTIAVSDEPDNSRDINLGEFVEWYDGLKRTAEDRTFSAIETRGGFGGASSKYGSITSRIGGVIWDIRTDNWAGALDVLGLQATGRKTEYFLSKLPVNDTIEVAVRQPLDDGSFTPDFFDRAYFDDDQNLVDAEGKPVEPTAAYFYYREQRNSISFVNYVPDDAWQIQIEYIVRSSVVD